MWSKDTRSSLQKLLKQEMETDDDHATVRESFSLVQNILFIDNTDVDVLQSRTKCVMVASAMRAEQGPCELIN